MSSLFRLTILTAVLAALFPSCTKEKTPEDAVKALIETGQKAAREHRPGGVLELMAEEFTDNHGNDKTMVKALLIREMLANKNLGIYLTTSDVTVDGNEAKAVLRVLVTGSSGLLPEKADSLKVEMKLRHNGERWLVHRADWTAASRE
jgi:hypothetical protein